MSQTLIAASYFYMIASTRTGRRIPILEVRVATRKRDEFLYAVADDPDPITRGRRIAYQRACRLLGVSDYHFHMSALTVGESDSDALSEVLIESLHEDDPAKPAVLAARSAIFFCVDCRAERQDDLHWIVMLHELGHWLVALSGWKPCSKDQNETAAWEAGALLVPFFPQANSALYLEVRRSARCCANVLPEDRIVIIREFLPVQFEAGC